MSCSSVELVGLASGAAARRGRASRSACPSSGRRARKSPSSWRRFAARASRTGWRRCRGARRSCGRARRRRAVRRARSPCTRTTGRESRSAARRAPTAHAAAAASARPAAACGGTRCRSTRPAAARAPRRAGSRSPAARTAGAAARAGCSPSRSASTARSTRTGAAYLLPPCTTRCATAAGSRPPVCVRRGAHVLQRGVVRLVAVERERDRWRTGLDEARLLPPMPSTWPAHSGWRGSGVDGRVEQRELDARRAAVEDQDRLVAGSRASPGPGERSRSAGCSCCSSSVAGRRRDS